MFDPFEESRQEGEAETVAKDGVRNASKLQRSVDRV